MDEYIKKNELLKFKADVYDEDGHVLYAVPTGYIVAMIPADVVEVVHAEWEEIDGGYRCTNCHHAPTVGIDNEFRLTNFCPNCGADMRG